MGDEISVIDLVPQELTLICWYRIPSEQPRNVLSQSVIDLSFLLEELLVFSIVLDFDSVIVAVSDVFVIRDVAINCAVSGLRDIIFTAWISFIPGPAVDGLLNDGPS